MDYSVTPVQEVDFVSLANLFVALTIVIAGGLSLIYIFIGGISFILSAGQEDKIKSAVHTIRYAVIGLVVTIFAIVAVQIVGQIFGFNLIPYLSWNGMREMIGEVFERLMGSSGQGGSNVPVGTLQ